MYTYVNEGGVKENLSPVVENINDGFTNARKAFDGFLDGASAGGASHSDDGEKGLGHGHDIHAAPFFHRHALWIPRHRGVVGSRRKVAGPRPFIIAYAS